MPTSTGAAAAGSVRGRAAISQIWSGLTATATRSSPAMPVALSIASRISAFGNCPKSGVRLALYASRPSFASSLA